MLSYSCGIMTKDSTRLKISLSHKLGKHDEGYKKQAETLRRRYATGEIQPWNKGLTADNDERVKRNTDKAHESLKKRYRTDETYRKLQVDHCKKISKKAGEVNRKRLKGKTYEELYGSERADEIRKKVGSKKFVLGETTCSICGVILDKNNTSPSSRKRGRTGCKLCLSKISTQWHRKNKIKRYIRIISVLGTECAICGFDDPRALQLDHINGGGSKLLKEKYKGNLYGMWTDIVKLSDEELKANFQILCANHNLIKKFMETKVDSLFTEAINLFRLENKSVAACMASLARAK